MIEIVEIDSAYCQRPKLVEGRGRVDIGQFGGLRNKSKGYKSGETMGLVLQFSKLAQVIDALFQRFDMPKQHRTGAPFAHSVPDPVHFFPFFGGFFSSADFISYLGIESFASPTSH